MAAPRGQSGPGASVEVGPAAAAIVPGVAVFHLGTAPEGADKSAGIGASFPQLSRQVLIDEAELAILVRNKHSEANN